MSGYVVLVERDELGGGYSTWSPDLSGCVAADDDYDECLRLMAEAVRMHVAGMHADGEPVPEPSALAALVIPAA
ncbi:MAG: type II toxin-antitoxin system HicB family antitoxin [Pseudonocardia sp.]